MTAIRGVARLTKNPVLKPVGQGDDQQLVCEMSVRFLNGKKPKNDSEDWIDKGFWAEVSTWGIMGESAAEFLRKGDKVYIIGNLVQDEWSDKDDPELTLTQLRVNASVVLPYLPDLESLQYKPRKSNQNRKDHTLSDSTTDGNSPEPEELLNAS
jgi:single-stranded DNA-binding protein